MSRKNPKSLLVMSQFQNACLMLLAASSLALSLAASPSYTLPGAPWVVTERHWLAPSDTVLVDPLSGYRIRVGDPYPYPPGIFASVNYTLACNATGQTTGLLNSTFGLIFAPGLYDFSFIENADQIGNFSTAQWLSCAKIGHLPSVLPVNWFSPPAPQPTEFLLNSFYGEYMQGISNVQHHMYNLGDQYSWCSFQGMCRSGGGAVNVAGLIQVSYHQNQGQVHVK